MDEKIKSTQFDISVFIAKYLIPIKERKWIVILIFLLGVSVALITTLFVKPEFVSQGTLLIEEPVYEISKVKGEQAGMRAARWEYVGSEIEKLKSTSFGYEVLKILPDKVKDDLKNPIALGPQIFMGIRKGLKGKFGEQLDEKLFGKKTVPSPGITEWQELIANLMERVKIEGDIRSGIIKITATTINREIAPILVKDYIDVWMATNLEENKKSIAKQNEFAEGQRITALKKFNDAERALLNFKRKYDIPGELEVARDVEINLEMERLQYHLNMMRERYETMDRIHLQTRTKEAGIVGNITVLDFPMVPMMKSLRKERTIVGTAILGSLIVGIGIVLLLDFLKGPIRHEIDITSTVNIPVLGYIPKV